MLDEVTDRIKNATDVIFGDKTRFGGVLLVAALIFIIPSVATFIPGIFGMSAPVPTDVCTQAYYIFPIFTSGFSSSIMAAELSCLGSSTPIWAIGLYYLELLALILAVTYIGVIAFNLQG